MTLSDFFNAGLRFRRTEFRRIHDDEGEDMNALLMVVISSVLALVLGMAGISLGVPIPEGMNGLPIVTNFFVELLSVLMLSWATSVALRLFGVTEHAATMLRLVAITRVWVIIGYVLMFFTLYGAIFHVIAVLQLAYLVSQTTKINFPVAFLAIVVGIVLTIASFIVLFLGLAFFLMLTIF